MSHSVGQAGLECRDPLASAYYVLGLKVHATMLGLLNVGFLPSEKGRVKGKGPDVWRSWASMVNSKAKRGQ